MGALCSCCRGGGVLDDGQVEMTQQQGNGVQSAQQRRKPTSKAETAEDRAKAEEAKRQAGLAAQRRQEAFDKTAVGRAARKVAADLAKPAPPPNRREPALRLYTPDSLGCFAVANGMSVPNHFKNEALLTTYKEYRLQALAKHSMPKKLAEKHRAKIQYK